MKAKSTFPTRAFRLLTWGKLLCALGLAALGVGRALALEGTIGIHDPSTVVTCAGRYYVFGTGRGIPFLTSSNGYNWERGGRIFDQIPDPVKAYVPKNDGSVVWAPDVIKLNGQYYIYYAVSSWGSYVSAVGLVTGPTLDPASPDFKWTDRGMIVHSSEGEDLNAIDPGVCSAPDGTLWLCYGSYHGNIELVQLDPKTGLRIATNSPVTLIASQSEASDIIYHGGYYYLFVNHGSCCQGTNSTYNIRVGRARKVTGPYVDRQGGDLLYGAGTLFIAAQGKDIGPGHFGLLMVDGAEKFSCHYEAELGRAAGPGRGGRSILDIRPLLWTTDGWPLPGENVPDGTYQLRSQLSGSILQASTNAPASEAAVKIARYLIRDYQKWTITPAGGGLYKIINRQSGDALSAAGAKVNLMAFTGADNQLWNIDQLADGSYRIVSITGKLALTTPDKEPTGNSISLQPFTGGNAQRWVIAAP